MSENNSGSTTAIFVVTLSSALSKQVIVGWKTADGTAKAGTDYIAASGTVTFEPGETAKQVQVTVLGRAPGTTDSRTFNILLEPPANAILDQELTEVTIVVTDDAGIAVTSLVVATGPRGLKGDPGLNSYELAKLQGFNGTLAQYIEQETAAGSAADRAKASELNATEQAVRAEDAAEVAEAKIDVDGTYADIASGLSATAEGKFFRVINGPGDLTAYTYYQKVSGAAVEKTSVASKKYNDNLETGIAENNSRLNGIDDRFLYRDGVKGYSLPILTPDNKVFGFNDEGGVSVTHVSVPGMDSIPPRDGPIMFPVVWSEDDGRIAIGLNQKTGLTFALLDEESINFIRDQLGDISGGYLPPSTIRGGFEVSSVREKDNFYYANVQERFNQKSFDAKQKKVGTLSTLVPDRIGPMEIRGVTGQSNSVLAGSTPVRESRALFPFSALSFEGRFFAQGGSGAIDGNTLVDFAPVFDSASATNNQLPATMTAFAYEHLKKEMGGEVVGQIVFTAGQGSVPMADLLPGTVNWNNYFTFLAAAKRVAATYGRNVVQRYVTIIQGENGANYSADFNTWANAIIPQIKSVLNQSADCKILLWQITGGGSGYENGVGALQLGFLDGRTDIIMPGPMYGYPTAADRTHLNAYGRMMFGECQAYMELMIANGFAWKPLRMKSAVRVGAIITVTVDLPPGLSSVSRDYGWMPSVPQDGFVYASDAGQIAISSIVYSGNTIQLTLASAPVSPVNERLLYGLNNSAGEGWAWFGGMAMAETNVLSPFNQLGHPVPKYVRHYLLRERIGVTA